MVQTNMIYIFGVIMITLICIILYIRSVTEHNLELEKIASIETKNRLEQRELDIIRGRTKKCPYYTQNNPKSCYFDSRYRCSWNEEARRCDIK